MINSGYSRPELQGFAEYYTNDDVSYTITNATLLSIEDAYTTIKQFLGFGKTPIWAISGFASFTLSGAGAGFQFNFGGLTFKAVSGAQQPITVVASGGTADVTTGATEQNTDHIQLASSTARTGWDIKYVDLSI